MAEGSADSRLNALNEGGNADVSSLSCLEAGDCTAGGSYTDARGNAIPWVADSAGGSWYQTKSVITPDLTGIDAHTHEGIARVNAVSCASPGSCEAVLSMPFLRGGAPIPVPYIAAEIGGLWDAPQPVVINTTDIVQDWAELLTVSCGHSTPAGTVTVCLAGGYYIDQQGHQHAMTGFGSVGDVVPNWGGFGNPLTVPGTNFLRAYAGGRADVVATSCLPSGFCSWGGYYIDNRGGAQPFTGSINGGSDDVNVTIPGIQELNAGGSGFVDDLSCALPGKCAVAGSYTDNLPRNQAYVDADLGNGWGSAQGIDGITNSPRAGAGTVSCPQDGGCVAGGFFDDAAGRTQAFIADQDVIVGSSDFGAFSGAQEVAGNLNSGAVHITATVRPSAAGQTPTGTVTVKARRIPAGKGAIKARTTTLCVITLKSAKGSCRLSASELGPGKFTLTASDAANSLYAASTSAGKTLTVTK